MHNNHDHICFQRRWEITEEISLLLGECNGLIKAISNTPLLPEDHQALLQVSMVKGAQATTAIEGNTLSLKDIEEINLNQHQSQPSKEYQEREVKNILEAFNFILKELLFENNIEYISENMLLDFHRRVGKDVGETFQATPGKFRRKNVYVYDYRAPHYSEIPEYIEKFCTWLKQAFHFGTSQSLTEAIIQAIVTHIYLVWIHPFSDGNGRTARLLEFYILMRAGVPNIASHILSNHYNQTRAMYYAKIGESTKKNDLTGFIQYAVQGLCDGLNEVLTTIQNSVIQVAWRSFIFETFNQVKSKHSGQLSSTNRRRRALILNWNLDKKVSGLQDASKEMVLLYQKVSERTFNRDAESLVNIKLLQKQEGFFSPNIGLLNIRMAISLHRQ